MNTPMTPEQKIIAIAEWEGWNKRSDFQPEEVYRFKAVWIQSEDRGFFIPDYLTSRDAICGAVARLPDLLRSNFNDNLAKRIGGKVYEVANDDDMLFQFALATPSQLADALLLTLGYKI